MSLFARFCLLLLAFALIPVAIVGIWILSSNAAIQDNSRQFHLQIANLSSQMAEIAAAEMNRDLGFVEDLERNESGNQQLDYKILQRASAEHSELELLSIVDSSGRELERLADPDVFPPHTLQDNSASSALIASVLKSGQAAVGSPILRQGVPLLPIAHPLPLGRCLYVEYSLRSLWRRMGELKVGRSGHVVLLDAQERKLPGIAGEFPQSSWVFPQQLSEDSGWLDNIRTNSGLMVGAYARIPSLGLWAMSLEPRAEAFSRPDGFVAQVLSFIILISFLAALGSWWVTGRLAPPLQQLIAASQRATRNDFGALVPEAGWNEMRELAHNFNKMMATLRSYHELQVERLVEQQARILSLVHSIPDGIVMADFNGTVLYINSVARLILGAGMSETSPGNSNISRVLPDPALRQMVSGLMTGKRRQGRAEVDIKSQDGNSRGAFAVYGITVRAKERDIGILVILRDITMQRQLESMKQDFFHSIVHDLRSPLTTIIGFLQMMELSKTISDKEKTYIEYAKKASGQLQGLVANILDIAKLESGTLKLKLAAVSAQDVVENMRSVYSIQAKAKNVELIFNVGQPAPSFRCDKELIERVVMNLMGNALKFTPEGGRITLSVNAIENRELIEFIVADTGPGIPKADLDAVFEKFRQLDSPDMKRSGYGLGLAICKKVVDLHGGRIWVESEVGQGSKFCFRLPTPRALSPVS